MSVTELVVRKLSALTDDQQRRVLEFITKLEPKPKQPLLDPFGMFAGHDTSEQQIAAARREMWGNFPRGDF